MTERRILVTGAAGKVGQTFLNRFLIQKHDAPTIVRALCHNRKLEARPGLEVVTGDISNREDVRRAMEGVTHVLHLATCKETPDAVMDVAVKGLFWLLEACRESPHVSAVCPARGRRRHGTLLLSLPGAGYRNAKAFRLSRVLCAFQSP